MLLDAASRAGQARFVAAVHDYQAPQLPITVRLIEHKLVEFLQYSRALLLRDAVLGKSQR